MKSISLLLAGSSLAAGLLLSPAVRPTSPIAPQRSSAVRCDVSELPSGWTTVTDKESGKPYYYNAATGVTQWQKPLEDRFADSGDDRKRSLSPSCSWRIRLDLVAPGTVAPVQPITALVRFAEEEGYEPPQGFLSVESCVPEGALVLGQQSTRWTLSEDPEDRKDSLWIWGLFSEPLYPFLLFELELAEAVEFGEERSIPAGRLYFQVDHRRKDGSVQLGGGEVTYKVEEKLAADLMGLSEVVYNEPVPCGSASFLDTASIISSSYV